MSTRLLNVNQIEYEDKPSNLDPHFPGHLHIPAKGEMTTQTEA